MKKQSISALVLIMIVTIPQLAAELGVLGEVSSSSQERIDIKEVVYPRSDVAQIFLKNVGETELVRVNSVYVDGQGYQLVTLESMKKDGRWRVSSKEDPIWNYINPGEAFVDENSIPRGETINITVRSLRPFIQATTHEFRVVTVSGTVASAQATAIFVLKEIEKINLIVISYEDGTKIKIYPDNPHFGKIVAITKDILSSMGTVIKTDVDPYAAKSIFIFSGYTYEKHFIDERIYLMFSGPYAGKLLAYGSLCCVLTRAKSTLWAMRSEKAMNELEEFIDSIKPSQEKPIVELPILGVGVIAAIVLAFVFIHIKRSKRSNEISSNHI